MKHVSLIFVAAMCLVSCTTESSGLGRGHRGSLRLDMGVVGAPVAEQDRKNPSIRELDPNMQLDSALDERMHLSYDDTTEAFEVEQSNPSKETPVFDLKPKDDKAPAIFLKPVKR